MMKSVAISIVLLTALSGAAWAQTTFELPRECRERHGVDPEKCVIQDGPAPLPWLRKKPEAVKPQPNPPPSPAAQANSPAAPRTSR